MKFKLLSDYDTHETVTCVSHYIYDRDRQRSLQHFLRIEGLPAKFKQVLSRQQSQSVRRLYCTGGPPERHVRRVRHPDQTAEEADAVSGAGVEMMPLKTQNKTSLYHLFPGVPTELHVRGDQLGQLPDQARGGAGQDGAPGHPLPRPHQHLQQREGTSSHILQIERNRLVSCGLHFLSFQ